MRTITEGTVQDQSFHELIATVERAESPAATILICGLDDEAVLLLARRIHDESTRSSGPFVVADFAFTPEELMEQELFGQEQGSTPGVGKSAPGLLDLANGGTLFIKEISAISELVQIKLLRVLREQRFVRLGGNRAVESDVRLVAGTKSSPERDLAGCVFRQDLYFRHRVIPLVLPLPGERETPLKTCG